jgi:hypothetical protein
MAMNGAAKLVLGVALAVTIGIIVLQPVVGAINDSTGVQTEVENVTADVGNYTDLAGYDLKSGTITVNSSGGTTTYAQGSDYEVALDNGSLLVLSSGTISDGETLNVSYDYQATDSTTTTVLGFIPVMFGTLLIVAAARGVQRGM